MGDVGVGPTESELALLQGILPMYAYDKLINIRLIPHQPGPVPDAVTEWVNGFCRVYLCMQGGNYHNIPFEYLPADPVRFTT